VRLFHFLIDWTVYGAVDFSVSSYLYTFGITGWQGPTPFRKPKHVEQAEQEAAQRAREEQPLRE
jgi:hypothetical protein